MKNKEQQWKCITDDEKENFIQIFTPNFYKEFKPINCEYLRHIGLDFNEDWAFFDLGVNQKTGKHKYVAYYINGVWKDDTVCLSYVIEHGFEVNCQPELIVGKDDLFDKDGYSNNLVMPTEYLEYDNPFTLEQVTDPKRAFAIDMTPEELQNHLDKLILSNHNKYEPLLSEG